MGWVERKLRGDEFWENIERAVPLVKARAEAILQELSYDPTQFTSHVGHGEGEEMWAVRYWCVPPKDYAATLGQGDLEVYLNVRGEVKRVAKLEDGHEQLLYGKDERISNGFTPAQVRERLGEPDYIGPPRRSVRDVCDESWKYKQNTSRTMTIEVCFKDGKVCSVSYLGK